MYDDNQARYDKPKKTEDYLIIPMRTTELKSSTRFPVVVFNCLFYVLGTANSYLRVIDLWNSDKVNQEYGTLYLNDGDETGNVSFKFVMNPTGAWLKTSQENDIKYFLCVYGNPVT